MCDTLYDGRVFRTLNGLDRANRECLAIEVGFSLPSRRVIAMLEELVALHITTDWLRRYNTGRPHDSLDRVQPLTFLPRETSIPEYHLQCLPDGGAYRASRGRRIRGTCRARKKGPIQSPFASFLPRCAQLTAERKLVNRLRSARCPLASHNPRRVPPRTRD